MKALVIASAAGALGLAGAVPAGEWRIVDASPRNMVAIDRTSIRADGHRRIYWMAIVDARADAEGGRYSVARVALDCERGTIRIVSLTRYAESGGVPIAQPEPSTQELQIIPGTTGEQMREAVCDGEWLTAPGIAEVSDFVALAVLTLNRSTEQ